jgi:hypothetical protein
VKAYWLVWLIGCLAWGASTPGVAVDTPVDPAHVHTVVCTAGDYADLFATCSDPNKAIEPEAQPGIRVAMIEPGAFYQLDDGTHATQYIIVIETAHSGTYDIAVPIIDQTGHRITKKYYRLIVQKAYDSEGEPEAENTTPFQLLVHPPPQLPPNH